MPAASLAKRCDRALAGPGHIQPVLGHVDADPHRWALIVSAPSAPAQAPPRPSLPDTGLRPGQPFGLWRGDRRTAPCSPTISSDPRAPGLVRPAPPDRSPLDRSSRRHLTTTTGFEHTKGAGVRGMDPQGGEPLNSAAAVCLPLSDRGGKGRRLRRGVFVGGTNHPELVRDTARGRPTNGRRG